MLTELLQIAQLEVLVQTVHLEAEAPSIALGSRQGRQEAPTVEIRGGSPAHHAQAASSPPLGCQGANDTAAAAKPATRPAFKLLVSFPSL